MIKKISLAVVVLALLIFAGVLTRNYLGRLAGPSSAPVLAPENTVLFVNIPDLSGTGLRWKNTALAKIANEPEVAAFLDKPLARLLSDPGSTEAVKILTALKPANIFAAVTVLSPDHVDALVGFEYRGGHRDFDAAVARLREEIRPAAAESTTETHKGISIVITQHGARQIATASHGRWGFVATSVDVIKSAIDRASAKNPSGSLAENPRYKKVLARMLPDPDGLVFLQTEKAIDALLAVGESLGEKAIPAHVGWLRSTEAVGATWKLDALLQRDAIFVLRSQEPVVNKSDHEAMGLTGADTMIYLDFSYPFASLPPLLGQAFNPPRPEMTALAGLAAEAYGPECGIIANWPAGTNWPTALVAVEVKDPLKANQFLQQWLTLFPESTASNDNGVRLYGIPALSMLLASPAIAQTDSFLLVGLDASLVAQAARRLPGSVPTLSDSPVFSSAVPAYKSANETFAFVDTRTLFERAYAALRPVILFGAMVVPKLAQTIDTTKLPQTETIAQHLPPIVLSQQRLADGTLIESSGPITMSQALLALSAAAWFSSPLGLFPGAN